LCIWQGLSERSFEQNVDAVKRTFEQGDRLNVERFIFSSTYSNYGVSPNGEMVNESSDLSPQSIYAESKIAAEEYLLSARDAGCAPLIFRFATLFGASPRTRFDLMVNQFVLEAYAKRKLLIYQREFSRSFIHIKDILDGILLALVAKKHQIRGEIFNLGDESGNFTKDEIVDAIRDQLSDFEVTYKDLYFDEDMRNIRVSFAKVRDELGFKSKRTLRDGIAEIHQLLQSGLIEDPYHEKYWNARLGIEDPA
jgi:nucleoside-diphosphate-sugar epimerase